MISKEEDKKIENLNASCNKDEMSAIQCIKAMDTNVIIDDFLLHIPQTCSICCEDYQKDDEIAISSNKNCPHVFHHSCILQWLMDNDDCPMCRCNFLDTTS